MLLLLLSNYSNVTIPLTLYGSVEALGIYRVPLKTLPKLIDMLMNSVGVTVQEFDYCGTTANTLSR